jgi:hypothetical protein
METPEDSHAAPSSPPSGLTQPSAHDLFAKYVFKDPPRAAEAIAAAIGPSDARLIDWGSLTLLPAELVDQAVGHFFPDLRFSARLRDEEIRIDVIFEHQSTVDSLMPVRFFCETAAIWAEARRQKQGEVPFVLNVVLFNGLTPWAAPRDLWTAIKGGAWLRAQAPHLVPSIPFALLDLAALTDDLVLAQAPSPAVRLALLLLKHARRGESVQTMESRPQLLVAAPLDVLGEAVRYVLQVDPQATGPVVADAVGRIVGPEAREMAMTWGEQMIEQGRREGEAKGKAEGKAEDILRVLTRRGLTLSEEQRRSIMACRDISQLEKWMDAALDANSVEQVMSLVTKH